MYGPLRTSFTVIQCHSLSSLPVTKLSCSLHLRLLDVSLSLSLSLPLPLDEPVVTAAKEDKKLALSNMSTRLSLYSPGVGSVLLSFLHPPVSLRDLCTLYEVRLLLRGVAPHDFALLRFYLHAAALLHVGSHVQRIILRPIATQKKNEKSMKQPTPITINQQSKQICCTGRHT